MADKKTRYAMVIDLHRCVGCGACEIACKTHNEVPEGTFLTYHINETTGTFPEVEYSYKPVMCNHCTKAACVKACPTHAMHKDEYGLTVHDPSKCVACGLCASACPYGAITRSDGESSADQVSKVKQLVEGCTCTPKEMQEFIGAKYPSHDPALDEYSLPVTKKGAPLKCQMCKHLVYAGDNPYCVDVCPAGARIFGNAQDIYGEIYELTQSFEPTVLKPEEGTEPAVYYIREFKKTW